MTVRMRALVCAAFLASIERCGCRAAARGGLLDGAFFVLLGVVQPVTNEDEGSDICNDGYGSKAVRITDNGNNIFAARRHFEGLERREGKGTHPHRRGR